MIPVMCTETCNFTMVPCDVLEAMIPSIVLRRTVIMPWYPLCSVIGASRLIMQNLPWPPSRSVVLASALLLNPLFWVAKSIKLSSIYHPIQTETPSGTNIPTLCTPIVVCFYRQEINFLFPYKYLMFRRLSNPVFVRWHIRLISKSRIKQKYNNSFQSWRLVRMQHTTAYASDGVITKRSKGFA